MAFSPADSAKTLKWWSADTLDGALNDGDLIGSLAERVAGAPGDALAQATSSKRPLMKKNLAFFGNRSAALFDGISQLLQTAAFAALAQPYTRFVVFKFVALGSDVFVLDGVGGANRSAVYCSAAGGNPLTFFAGGALSGASLDTNAHYTAVVANGGSSSLRRDGVQTAAGNPGSHAITGSTWGASFNPPTNGACGNVYVAEEIITGALTSGELAAYEDYLAAKYFGALPAAPSALSLSAPAHNQVTGTFTSNSTNETGFRVERKTGAGGTYAEIAASPVTSGAFSDNTVSAGTTYYYRVRAYNANGNSAYLAEQSVATPAGPSPPAAPSGLTLYSNAYNLVTAYFADNSSDETGFEVERKTGSGGTYAVIQTLGANDNDFADSAVAGATTYYYRVRAFNGVGYSAYSNEIGPVTTPAAPPLSVAGDSSYRAADPLPSPLPSFTSTSAVRWTTTHGILLTSESPRVAYNGTDYRTDIVLEPANEYRLITVTGVTAGLATASAVVEVSGTLSPPPDFGTVVNEEEPADVVYAPDKRTRTVRYNGDPVQQWKLVWTRRRLSERTQVKAFRSHHRLDLPFFLDDQVLGELTRVVADGGIETEGVRANLISFSLVVREA